ncbi:MAG: adenine phosphoribosyltransferase [Spirochaetales bacterium]|nr:adenine phosphoribosyltransferase [Spirochaetales bacterium]
MGSYNLDWAIRKVPDFPKPGILFYDITGILATPEAFRYCIDELSEQTRESGATAIAGIEARGFVFASPVAERCGLPLILVRKKGKLPGQTVSRTFSLEYGADSIEIHTSDLQQPRRVLLIDDLIATGGTLSAAAGIFREHGSEVAGVSAVVGLPFLKYGEALTGFSVRTLINYDGE